MNKKRFIVIIGLILVIILVLGFVIKDMYNTQTDHLIDGPTAKGQLLLSGIGVFSEKYTGNIETKEITQKIQDLTKQDIPDLYKDVKKYNDSKLEKYYEKNASDIEEKFGIQTLEEFIKFTKSLKEANIDLKTWYKAEIKRDTFIDKSKKDNYAYVEYEIVFKNEETIRFSLYIAKITTMMPNYIIDIIK